MSIRKVFEVYYNGDKNFMTPHVFGHVKKKFGEEYLLIEKSEGRGFSDEQIYGASALVYDINTGATQKIELSECYTDKSDVDAHIKNISKSEFENANRYGEVKTILTVI